MVKGQLHERSCSTALADANDWLPFHKRWFKSAALMSELMPLLVVIGAGVAWQRFSFGGVDATSLRNHLNALLVYLLIPALVFHVMVLAPLDRHLLYVVIGGLVCIAFSGLLAWGMNTFLARFSTMPRSSRGALVLATVFGNGLGVALPLIHQLYDGRQDKIALSFDLLATIPVSWTIGVYVALRFGNRAEVVHPVQQILKMPPIWAVGIALSLNAMAWVPPTVVLETIESLAQGTITLMLFSLGLAIQLRTGAPWRWIALPVVLRMGGGFLSGLLFGLFVGLPAEEHRAMIAVTAAPAIMMGVVFCDRFGLDTPTFALTMSVGVIAYLILLPLVLDVLPL